MFGWMKRQASELWADVRAFVEGRVPGEDDPVVRDGRVFEVPEGLVPRVMRLYEDAERACAAGNGEYAGWKLWRLILDRCPETREGRWRLVFRTDGKIVVREVTAYVLLHAANPKLATVVALNDRTRPAAIMGAHDDQGDL